MIHSLQLLSTPLQAGIYSQIAVALKGGPWREASIVLMAEGIAQGMEAEPLSLAAAAPLAVRKLVRGVMLKIGRQRKVATAAVAPRATFRRRKADVTLRLTRHDRLGSRGKSDASGVDPGSGQQSASTEEPLEELSGATAEPSRQIAEPLEEVSGATAEPSRQIASHSSIEESQWPTAALNSELASIRPSLDLDPNRLRERLASLETILAAAPEVAALSATPLRGISPLKATVRAVQSPKLMEQKLTRQRQGLLEGRHAPLPAGVPPEPLGPSKQVSLTRV